jgi:hypothetical protein
MIDSKREQERLQALLDRRDVIKDELTKVDRQIGEVIAKMRNDRELSLRDVGVLLHCDFSNYHKVENGHFSPKIISRVQEYFPNLGVKVDTDDPYSAILDRSLATVP